ncbi:T9SS type A sorting domain-containing protein [Hymenobacter glacialis]|uniref:T9SS type A sorting domain-containing protein n=1 Tax=Hymenobacter glacialis TaxID=1908236 RepID=UPI001300ECA2|nr:T9SS type A sorting domain-containing protein [Hymenobacter glacialis]
MALARFAAALTPAGVHMTWATATEKNNDRFEVQRSADGQSFQTIGTVKGNGNSSSLREYAFVDGRPFAGQSYYRLRQVDSDGTSAFSPVAAVHARAAGAAFPNPTADAVLLPATLGPAHYRVLNAVGQTLLSGKATGNDRLDLTTLRKGVYFLELTDAAGRTTQRLVRE